MTAWSIAIIGILVVFAAWQLWWTRQHGRNLDKHAEERRKAYERYR